MLRTDLKIISIIPARSGSKRIIDKNIVKVQLMGNCVSCSVNQMTLKNGVEMTIKKHAPEIQEVVSIE